MKRLALALCLLSVHANAATLKTDIIVAGDTVTLGDVFDGLTVGAERTVTAAPLLGRSLLLDARTLGGLARSNAVEWQPESATVSATVRRASQTFDSAAIAEAIQQQLPASALGKTTVKLDNQQTTLHAPVGQAVSLTVNNLTLEQSTHRFGASVQIESNGQKIAEIPVSGKVQTLVQLPVLTRPMRRGDTIAATDIEWQEREMTAGTEQFLFAAEELIGKTPRQAVRAGVPLRGFDLAMPVVVTRGSQVTMIFESGRLHLSTQGRALSDGAVGDTIRVVNLMSSRTIEGRVEADGVIRIGTAPAPRTNTQMAAAPQAVVQN